MKITDTYLVDITAMGMDGEGVAKVDGVPVFVPFAAVGDLCKIKITKVNKGYAFGKLVKVVKPAECRETPPCPYYGECGGCSLQHVSFTAENAFKRDYLQGILNKFGFDITVGETVFAKPYGYRNKLQMPFSEEGGKITLGFFKRSTHDVIGVTNCLLHAAWSEKLIRIITDWANASPKMTAYNETSNRGLLRHVVARFEDNFLSVTLVINGANLPDAKNLYNALNKEFDCNLYISENTKKTNVIMGNSVKLIAGEDKTLTISDVKLNLSPLSFLQVNDEIRDRLYAEVAKNISDCDVCFDVYSGVGILTAQLARRIQCAKFYGVEIVPEAVENANGLMWANGLDGRVKNICGDAAEILPDLVKRAVESSKTDVKHSGSVVIDPPRKGCDEKVLNAIIQSVADKIVYISCNPATLARDLKLLTSNYKINTITPFNMFPRTSHVETLVCLARK